MHLIETSQISCVHAGLSDTTVGVLEGGTLGLIGGAVIGGVLASPVYFSLLNNNGICLSHYLAGMMLVGFGILTGAMVGSAVGSSSGYLISHQSEV